MPQFSLQINVDPALIPQIVAAGQQIVISKQAGVSTERGVAWLAFSPLQSNTVTWEDKYAVYASQDDVESGATIRQLASMAAIPQSAHAFQDNVFAVVTPVSPLGAGQYEIRNESGQPLTFGLAQGATLNGTALDATPIFAATVLPGEWLDVTPFDTVSIFLQAQVNNAMCPGTVTGPSCLVSFGGGKAAQTVQFVPQVSGFEVV